MKVISLNTLMHFQKKNAVRSNALFLICGNLTLIFHLFGLKMLLKLLINIIGYGKLSGLEYLSDEQKQQVNIMLYASPILSTAYFFKEDFLKILDCKDRDSAKIAMSDWINSALDSDIPQL